MIAQVGQTNDGLTFFFFFTSSTLGAANFIVFFSGRWVGVGVCAFVSFLDVKKIPVVKTEIP